MTPVTCSFLRILIGELFPMEYHIMVRLNFLEYLQCTPVKDATMIYVYGHNLSILLNAF